LKKTRRVIDRRYEEEMIKKILIAAFLMAFVHAPPAAADTPPKKGGVFPEIKLDVPKDDAEKKYLGLCGGEHFTVPDIQADVVLIEVFSMYCPHCQAAAPDVNKLYEAIQQDPDLKDRVKLIGIGAGNTAMEVDVFREKYQVPFPLFTDDDFSAHKVLGEVHTPYFIGLRKQEEGGHTIFYSELGGFEDPGAFLKMILSESGLK
jgi:peroxiredoxin